MLQFIIYHRCNIEHWPKIATFQCFAPYSHCAECHLHVNLDTVCNIAELPQVNPRIRFLPRYLTYLFIYTGTLASALAMISMVGTLPKDVYSFSLSNLDIRFTIKTHALGAFTSHYRGFTATRCRTNHCAFSPRYLRRTKLCQPPSRLHPQLFPKRCWIDIRSRQPWMQVCRKQQMLWAQIKKTTYEDNESLRLCGVTWVLKYANASIESKRTKNHFS